MNPATDTITAADGATVTVVPATVEENNASVEAVLAALNAPPVEHVIESAPVSETVTAPIAEIVTTPAVPETQAPSASVPETTPPAPAQVGAESSPAPTPAPTPAPVIDAKRVFVSFLFPTAAEFTKKQVADVNEIEYIAASSLVNMLVKNGEAKLVRKQPQAGRGKPTDIFALVPKETKKAKKK